MENTSIDEFMERVSSVFASPAFFVCWCSVRPVKQLIRNRYELIAPPTAFRYATLVYASFIIQPTFGREHHRDNSEYLERFDYLFQQTIRSWSASDIVHPSSVIDTVHASAMMLIWALSSAQDLGIVHTYIEALHDAFACLQWSPALLASTDTALVQCLCLCAFEGLDNCLVFVDQGDEGHIEHVLYLLDEVAFPVFEILEKCFELDNPGASSLPFDVWSPRYEMLMRLGNLLNILVALYFRTGMIGGQSREMGELILSVLKKTVGMIQLLSCHFERAAHFIDHVLPDLLNLESTDLTEWLDYRDLMRAYDMQDDEMPQLLVFGLTYLIDEIIINSDHDTLSTPGSVPAAIVLCRILSGMALRWYHKQEITCLFLAGIVVKASVDTSGNYSLRTAN
jgi:hypothetical protein